MAVAIVGYFLVPEGLIWATGREVREFNPGPWYMNGGSSGGPFHVQGIGRFYPGNYTLYVNATAQVDVHVYLLPDEDAECLLHTEDESFLLPPQAEVLRQAYNVSQMTLSFRLEEMGTWCLLVENTEPEVSGRYDWTLIGRDMWITGVEMMAVNPKLWSFYGGLVVLVVGLLVLAFGFLRTEGA